MAMPGELPMITSGGVGVPEHPPWCVEDRGGIHYSRELPPWGRDRIIYATTSLFRMDGLPAPLVGVNLRLCAADVTEDYLLDLDQARVLSWSINRLVRLNAR